MIEPTANAVGPSRQRRLILSLDGQMKRTVPKSANPWRNDERGYLKMLEHARHMLAWCLQRLWTKNICFLLAAGLLLACARDVMNNSELHQAAEQGNRKRVQSLLDSGSDINAFDDLGYTPLLHAVSSKKADGEFIRFLLKNGADHRLTARVSWGAWSRHHGLSLALASGDIDKARVFLDAGADIRYVREGGFDAMMDAASSASPVPGHPEAQPETLLRSLLAFLLSSGVPPSRRAEKGQTALMILSDRIAFDAVQQLVRAGADEAQLKWTPPDRRPQRHALRASYLHHRECRLPRSPASGVHAGVSS